MEGGGLRPPSSMQDNRSDFQRRIGVGEKQYRFGRHVDTSRDLFKLSNKTGEIGGKQTEHWDGRVDATVFAPTVAVTTQTNLYRS